MVKAKNDLRDTAEEEALRLGANIRWEGVTRDRHLIGVICFNGAERKIFIGSNKSNPHIFRIIKTDVRLRVEQMK